MKKEKKKKENKIGKANDKEILGKKNRQRKKKGKRKGSENVRRGKVEIKTFWRMAD